MRRRGHGTDAKAIWRWETARSQPQARILPDLAEVLGAASVDELYSADDEEAAPVASPTDDLKRAFAAFVDGLQNQRVASGR